MRFLRAKGWHVERLPGGAMRGGGSQSGLPDLLVTHHQYGVRFIEVKQEVHYRFTTPQRWKFPLLDANGLGIWILTEASEAQYERLFKSPNLWDYMKKSEVITKDTIENFFDELEA
jgi:hypothetical protein